MAESESFIPEDYTHEKGDATYDNPETETKEIQDELREAGEEESDQKQREFEKRTKKGFEKLKELFEGQQDATVKNKLLAEAMALEVEPDVPDANEVILLMSILFDRLAKMQEIAKINFSESKRIWPNALLSDLKPSVLEVAAKQGAFSEWPLQNVWSSTGFKTIYNTDIDVEPSEEFVDQDEECDIYFKRLDALNPEETLQDEQFDVITSEGFFGQPTIYLAQGNGKDRAKVEFEVIDKLSKYLRPGGAFVFGTREKFAIDIKELESRGLEVANFNFINGYLVVRKPGKYES